MTTTPVFSGADLDRLDFSEKEPFFAVPVWKLAVMSVLTFSLYQIYWLYRSWRARRLAGEDVSPFWRAILGVLFFPALASRVREKRLFHDLEAGFSPVAVAIMYFLFQLVWRLPDPAWLLGHLSFLPLAIVQAKINHLHAHLGAEVPKVPIGLGTVIAATVGALWWALVLIGLLAPEV